MQGHLLRDVFLTCFEHSTNIEIVQNSQVASPFGSHLVKSSTSKSISTSGYISACLPRGFRGCVIFSHRGYPTFDLWLSHLEEPTCPAEEKPSLWFEKARALNTCQETR